MRRWGLILLAVAAFVAVLVARFPLGWAVGFLPTIIRCDAPTGTLWQGRCGTFSVAVSATGPVSIGALAWDLDGAALLRARLQGELRVDGEQVRGATHFAVTTGDQLVLEHLTAELPLDRKLIGIVPANWTGRVHIADARVALDGRRLLGLSGEAQVRDVVAQGPRPDPFGSYRLRFPAGADGAAHRGELQDIGGPLELNGTLVLQPDLNFELDTWVKPRADATPGVVRLIEFLGATDAQGRRNFSASGNF